MKLKLNKLHLACAAVLASGAFVSGQAFAHAPNVVPDLTLNISGASAQDKALRELVNSLCVANTLDTFKDIANPAKKGKAYTSYFCTIDATLVANMNTNQTVLINKRSKGGSGMGVVPVADATPIETMNINNGNCTIVPGSRTWDCSIGGAGDLFDKVPTAGISDVEPAMFVDPNVAPDTDPVTPGQIAKLDITATNAVIFGVPVTEKLYRALQIAQGFNETMDDEANMPSLSTSQVNALITGNIKNWDQLLVNVGGVATPLTQVTGVIPPAPEMLTTDPLVHYCRRVPGSGTQAQMNAKFANTPCVEGVQKPVRATDTNPMFGPIVQENRGSGDLTVCLRDKNTANKWAIGVQSLEKQDPAFRFVKIDGDAPTLVNVAENKYRHWVETTIQWRNTANAGPSGDVLAILNTIATNASTPATIHTLNASFVHDFGTGAYLALNTNGHVPSFPHEDTNPVTTATHAITGTPNSCAVPTVNIQSTL